MSALEDLIEIVKSRPELDHDDVVAQVTMYAEEELSALHAKVASLEARLAEALERNVEMSDYMNSIATLGKEQ